MKSRLAFVLSLLLLGACLTNNAAAQVDARVTDRSPNGVLLQWAAKAEGIEGFQISVRELATGAIVVPPMDLQQDNLRLPIDGLATSVLRPEIEYELTVRPLPDGALAKALIPAFAAMEAGPAPANPAIEALLLEADLKSQEQENRDRKMLAQAEMLRSMATWHTNFAEFRIQQAIATDVELEVWRNGVKGYFERRSENMKGKMEVKEKYEQMADQNLRKRQNGMRRQLQNLFNDPKRSGKPSASLNFLVEQFSNTPIGYGTGLDDYFSTHPSHSRWDLHPEMLEAIRVKTPMNKGAQVEFTLSKPITLDFDWWPPLLREPVFQPAIMDLIAKRDHLLELGQQNPNLPIEATNELELSLAALFREFYNRFPPPWKNMPTRSVLELIAVEGHLGKLANEVEAIRDRGTMDAMGKGQYFDPLEDGRNAATLISWMTRNGMEFADPRPGSESVYHDLLQKFKELYVVFGEPLPEPFDQMPKTNQPAAVPIPRPQ